MALSQLAERISKAMNQLMRDASASDQVQVLNQCIREISSALLESDVDPNLVHNLQTTIINTTAVDEELYKKQGSILLGFRRIMNSGKPSFTPNKGEKCVVTFVGLQGSGKTRACNQYALYHQKKGWKPALVSLDNQFHHLMQQSSAEANYIPLYEIESNMESDTASVALKGVEKFKKQDCDLIIVDTTESHTLEEIHQLSESMKSDLVIFVIDSSIGRSAFHQAQAFKQTFANGAVILTNMDAHAKGVGALCAVAATKSPVTFIATGDHLDDFQEFDNINFVIRLLGMGDLFQARNAYRRCPPPSKEFTLRTMYECFVKFDDDAQMYWSSLFGPMENEAQEKIKRFRTILGSMTNEELDSCNPELLSSSRIMTIAKDSGYQVTEVIEVLEKHKPLAKAFSNFQRCRCWMQRP